VAKIHSFLTTGTFHVQALPLKVALPCITNICNGDNGFQEETLGVEGVEGQRFCKYPLKLYYGYYSMVQSGCAGEVWDDLSYPSLRDIYIETQGSPQLEEPCIRKSPRSCPELSPNDPPISMDCEYVIPHSGFTNLTLSCL
jgi:hypothetical protein